MYLGAALTTQEANHFATKMNIPLSERDIGHYFELEDYLSNACGIKRPGILLRPCDSLRYPLVFSLMSNYDLRPDRDLSVPFKKMVKIVREVFGHSKDVMWWLDLVINHDSESNFVSGLPHGNNARHS